MRITPNCYDFRFVSKKLRLSANITIILISYTHTVHVHGIHSRVPIKKIDPISYI